MCRTLRSIFIFLGEDLLGDHPHGLGQLDDELALSSNVVGDADHHAGPDLGVVAADVDRAVVVVDVDEAALIQAVWNKKK